MALIKCPECNKEVSDKASSCPHCGYPLLVSEGKAIFKCERTSYTGMTTIVPMTVKIFNGETLLATTKMGGMVAIPVKEKITVNVKVTNFFGNPTVTLYPGKTTFINIIPTTWGRIALQVETA